MARESYSLGGYWGSRREPIDVCIQRTYHFLTILAQCDPLFARWYRPIWSEEEPRHQILLTETAVRDLIVGGQERRDDDGRIVEEWGVRVGLWNGGMGDDAIHLSIRCGNQRAQARNGCSLRLHSLEPRPGSHLADVATLTAVLEAVIDAWNPDWGSVDALDYIQQHPQGSDELFMTGWITYLSPRFDSIPVLPDSVRVEPLRDGTLIVITDEVFSPSNTSHLDTITRTRALLRANVRGRASLA